MYNFIDTTEVSGSVVLPSEALMINGEYIENLIPGYRTLHVSGREVMSPEIELLETGASDGAEVKKHRFPARTIVVTYQLMAAGNTAFRNAFNTLASILNVKDAELIFNDENDKFYIGTPSLIDEVEPGRNHVIGSFEILCADPFKYSVIEYEATPWDEDPSTILVDYGGTYKAFPTLEASFYNETDFAEDTAVELTGNGECGYVAFFNEDEKIIQLGSPEEADGEEVPASQTLVNQEFQTTTAWGTNGSSVWAKNGAATLPAVSAIQQMGSVSIGVATHETQTAPAAATILKKTETPAGSPKVYYKVTAKAHSRTSTSVKIDVQITASLKNKTDAFNKTYGLMGSMFINGTWYDVNIKKENVKRWEGQSGHSVSLTATINGLSATTATLTGIRFTATRTDDASAIAGRMPEIACNDIPIGAYVADVPATYYLSPLSYGDATNCWHGPAITRTLKADKAGELGAVNFSLSYKQKMHIGKQSNATNQLGGFQAHAMADDGTVIAAVRIVKNKYGKQAKLMFYVNNTKVHEQNIGLEYSNKYFGQSAKEIMRQSEIIRYGEQVDFKVAGITKTFHDSAIATLPATKISFMFEKWGAKTNLSYNGLYGVKFIKHKCDTYANIPNKFTANDVVQADCKAGEIYLNGMLSQELGALGNDWEDFYLKPGMNQIGFAYSDWVELAYAPQVKVKYREVFL